MRVFFFNIEQKLGDDNFFSFEVGLSFLIKVCLFLRFKNILKKLRNVFLFKLIFFMFLYYFDVMRLTINFNFFSIIDFFSYGKEEIN